MTHLRLYETPNLGVHQTGSSSYLAAVGGALFALYKTLQRDR